MITSIFQRVAFYILVLLLTPLFCAAQQSKDSTSASQTNKIGLALSGGGAKGFAHIGVLKVFEEEGIPVHMVSGTSMGSIVGSLYAIGYTPQEIEEIALSSDWSILFNDSYRINPKNIANSILNQDSYLLTFPLNGNRITLPSGLIDGQNVSMMLYRLMLPYHDVKDFSKLPIPFSSVATDLSTGRAHTFTNGYLPDAVRASIAIPTIFKPVKIDTSTYIDGGVSRNIPAVDVKNLGADVVVASDVGNPVKPVDSLNTFVDVLFQSVGFHQQESDKKQKKYIDFYIRPEVKKFSSFSYDQVAKIINRGEQAARKIVPEIKAYLAEHNAAPPSFRPVPSPQGDTLIISGITYGNIEGLLQQQANLALDIQPPSRLTLTDLEQKINRLYNSGLFSQISYRLREVPGSDSSHLILEFQKKEQEYAGFSLRYDSHYKAALLFGASITDNIFWSDRLTMRLRAGEILELNTKYSTPVTLAPLSKLNLEIDFQRSPIDFYSQNQALSTINVEKLTFRPSASIRFFQRADFEAGIEAELYNLNQAVGNTLVLGNTSFLLKPFFQIDFSTLNRPYFPTKGQSLHVKTVASDESWGSITSFVQGSGSWLTTFPVVKDLNITNELFAGYSSVSTIPLHYNYYLGGMSQNPVFKLRQRPFMGHATQQLRATNVLGWRSQLQLKLGKNFYLTGGMDIAHLADTWTLNLDSERMQYGYSLSIGATSIIGPIEMSLSTPDFSGGYALKIDVGYQF